jgi:hypothetical protein
MGASLGKVIGTDPERKHRTQLGDWVKYKLLSPEFTKRWVTDPIESDKDVVKMDCDPESSAVHRCKLWGPYDKHYTLNYLKQYAFTPPEKVDGIPVLSACDDIPYLRFKDGLPSLPELTKDPKLQLACWFDSGSPFNPYLGGSETFMIRINDPAWFIEVDPSQFMELRKNTVKPGVNPHGGKKNKTRRARK